MELVQTKVIAAAAALLLAVSCAEAPQPQVSGARFGFDWTKHAMDGSRTGVTAVIGDAVEPALGRAANGRYTAPNGKVFTKGSTPQASKLLLDVQPDMAYLKEVLGWCPRGMQKEGYESEHTNWTADAIMAGVEETLGKHVDMGFANYGGIRIDMPQGDVLLDDIVSMYPFRNYLVYVKLKGSDIRALLEQMAQTKMQAIGGVRLVMQDRQLQSVEIGGEPLDDNKTYGLATIDFLLDGGDGYFASRNALELVKSDVQVKEWMIQYVRSLTAAGKNVESEIDGRVEVIK